MSVKEKAVVLLSGGLDSTTLTALAKQKGFELYCLSFYYGQRHARELEAAARIAKRFGAAEHLVIDLALKKIGGSALTDFSVSVPKSSDVEQIGHSIPVTYVPARNTIFLAYALAWAEVLGAGHIFIGVNALDYSGYPDCRPEYIAAFEKMANLATKAAVEGRVVVKIRTPLSSLSKAQIIQKGIALGVDYSLTHSCYDPTDEGLACGQCDSCLLRKKGFKEAGLTDPAAYRNR